MVKMSVAIRAAATVEVSTALEQRRRTPSKEISALVLELQVEIANEARAAKRPVKAAWQNTTAAFPVSISSL